MLALGESHYEWKPGVIIENLTCELVREQAESKDTYAYWTKVVTAFLNRSPSKSDKYEFWNSVMFYNYIQCSVGNSPRIPPTRKMWDESEDGFREILLVYQPSCIIVLGERLWNNLPDYGERGPDLIVDDVRRESWLYPTEKGKFALASRIKHPSWPGFRALEWHPWIRESIELSKRLGIP